MNNGRILVAEAIGTTILMLGGPGVAVLAAGTGALGEAAVLAVALGFGLALMIAAYTIGHVSGCHINPAVTLGMLVLKKIEMSKAIAYWIGQVIGAVAGGFLIFVIRNGADGSFNTNSRSFATNLWDSGNGFFGFWPMVITEIVLTAVLVLAVLSTTRRGYSAGAVGLHVGMTLTLIHLISIPVDNTSVNPARSLGMAVFAGGDSVEQLWAFILFPLIGALLGVLLWLAIDDADIEDTMLADAPLGLGDRLADVRDAAGGVAARTGLVGDTSSATGEMTIGDHSLDGGADAGGAAGPAQGLMSSGGGGDHPYGSGSHAVLADDSMPNGYPIKGNVDSMLYHRPDSRNYGATVAEVWFDTSSTAEANGFSLSPTHASAEDPTMHPYGPGSHAPLPGDAAPDGYSIKGNVDSMLYHRTDSRNYGATVAEMWFDSVESAEAAGFSLSPTHPDN